MCMRNLNTDVTFFKKKDELSDILEMCNGRPEVNAYPSKDSELVIDTLCFMLSINALERKESSGDAPEHKNVSDKIDFNTKYQLCIRLSETDSGKFVDLDSQDFLPASDQTVLCRKVYSMKRMYKYRNISVARPPRGKDLCVLKVLVRSNDESEWTVQSMHPIKLIEKGNDC